MGQYIDMQPNQGRPITHQQNYSNNSNNPERMIQADVGGNGGDLFQRPVSPSPSHGKNP